MSNNTIVIKGTWNEHKSKLRKAFPQLEERDLFFEIGRKNEMLEKLQLKLGKSQDELNKVMEAV